MTKTESQLLLMRLAQIETVLANTNLKMTASDAAMLQHAMFKLKEMAR